MPRTTNNSMATVQEMELCERQSTESQQNEPVTSKTTRTTIQEAPKTKEAAPKPIKTPVSSQNPGPTYISLTQYQFSQLLSNAGGQNQNATFSNCSATFDGGRNSAKVDDFIATILVYKEAERVSDAFALLSLPLLLKGYASSWWQGVKAEADTFEKALNLLRSSFSPPKPDWRIFAEVFQDKQYATESTDAFICRKRKLLAMLKEKVAEKTQVNLLFHQIRIGIREKLNRDQINGFQDLLQQAREVEVAINENCESRQECLNPKAKTFIPPAYNNMGLKCQYCRKKNHTAENCYKKAEDQLRGQGGGQEKLHCYGCGAAGYYKTNCPTCNGKDVAQSPKEMDFNAILNTIVGRDVPTVPICVSGFDDSAYLDTAARTSIAGRKLFESMKRKGHKFTKAVAEITLADGVPNKKVVYTTITNIKVGGRLNRIRFVCLPYAVSNHTLLGIDFLEQAGIVMDLPQRCFYYKDEPRKVVPFILQPPKVLPISKRQDTIEETALFNANKAMAFMFGAGHSQKVTNDVTPPRTRQSMDKYSPGGIQAIFEGSVPDTAPVPGMDGLFPSPKRLKPDDEDEIFLPNLKINSIEVNLSDNILSTSQTDQLRLLLSKQSQIFKNNDQPIKGAKHYINTGDSAPIAAAPYRLSPAMKQKLHGKLQEMLQEGIIREAESPWAFPVVLIPKKDKDIRVCVDYRRLNAITVTDTYPLPRMEDLLHAAKTTKFMSTLDLKAGYWQIEVAEKDQEKTAFTTPFGIYVFNRMPFGLKNAPATFQRVIDKFRRSLPNILILAYLDDIIICSNDFETHLKDLESTFQKLTQYGFHLNKEKCFFCKPEIKYLGHILSQEGLKVDEEKTAAIIKRPDPKNLKQLTSFLQTCSWFRRFISNFASVAKPLSYLTRKNVVWNWGTEQKEAFEKLKELLVSPPILQQVNEDEGFIIHTDASNYALGAVLMQGEKENQRPIEYASRLLLKAEQNYSTTEREALAVVWAVQKFRGYVEGGDITIQTDHQPLKWLFTLKSPTGRLARWALLLQTFNLKFEYTPGKQNVIADTLSRPPFEGEEDIKACSVAIDLPRIGASDFRIAQMADPDLNKIITSFEKDDENVLRLTEKGFMMIDGVLYRYCAEEDEETGQMVIPKEMRKQLLFNFHNDPTAGHMGIEKTISRITPYYYWSGMRSEIIKYVKSCIECQKYKPSNLKPMGLIQTLSSNQRFEVLAVDLFGPLPRTKDGYQWIFMVEDICTRWIEIFPLKEGTAEQCALKLLNEVVLRYGVPRQLHSDNGSQFISAVMQKLTFCLGIKQSLTPVYHPQSNPVERKNRDMKCQLAIYVGRNHQDWSSKLPAIRFSMNSAKCDSTGHSPAYLTFGRELRSPGEAHMDLKAITLSENFVPQITPHLLKMADDLKISNEFQEKMQKKNKDYVDQTKRPQTSIEIGDQVLVKTHILSNAKQATTAKFVPKRDGPYTVVQKKGSSLFVIAAEDAVDKPIATVHVSDITLVKNHQSQPLYPMRKRGRPKTHTATVQHNQSQVDMMTSSLPMAGNSHLRRSLRIQEREAESCSHAGTSSAPEGEFVALQHKI